MQKQLQIIIQCAVLAFSFNLATTAQAAYRCESGGKVTYSDVPCGGSAKAVDNTVISDPQDVRDARRHAAQDKRDLQRIEQSHDRQLKQDEAAERRANQRASTQQKKCAKLAMRAKWAKEDAEYGGKIKAINKAERKRKHAEEQYALECR